MPEKGGRPRNIQPWKLVRKPVPKPTRVEEDKREKKARKHKKHWEEEIEKAEG